MKVAYIAHPIGDDVEVNLIKIKRIVREINLNEPDIVPFVPYYIDCIALDDSNELERERGIKNDTELINRGFIDEVRLYGHTISKGMLSEIKLFKNKGIEIKPMTEATQLHYKMLKF